jgi:choline-sulfatase
MSRQHPNFLILMADQQSPHVLGHAGDRVVRTPNLDRLAADGVRFTSTYCGSPLCVPSRMTFLTGRSCSEIGVWSNGCVLDSEIPTFAGALAVAGYESVLCGRMHFVGPDQRHGFTRRIIGDVSQSRLPEGWEGPLLAGLPPGTTGQSRAAVETAGAGRTAYQAYDEAVTDAACRFLEEWDRSAADQPLSLLVGYVLPHCPFICPPDLFAYYYDRVDLPQLPEGYLTRLHPAARGYRERREFDSLTDEQVRVARASYYGLVEYHDRLCGRVINTLRRTRFAADTMVVYLSDHGDMAGERRIWTKSNFYEGAAAVPMIWCWPDRFPAGATVSGVTSLLDVGPTLIEMAHGQGVYEHFAPGSAGSQATSGRSLQRFLTAAGEHTEPAAQRPNVADRASSNLAGWPDDAFSEYCGLLGDRPSRMLREGPWKLVHYHGYDQPQLFHLGEDPGEWQDRRDDPARAAIRDRLHDRAREGWDGDRIEAAMARQSDRREEAVRRARRFATAERDGWDVPRDANRFPLAFEKREGP